MICSQDHGQYLTTLCLFVYNNGVYELITHYRDSIHNREYHNFYYRDSIIFTIAQPLLQPLRNIASVVSGLKVPPACVYFKGE